jgi:predicted lipid-binding transport protein (Tim44 family)
VADGTEGGRQPELRIGDVERRAVDSRLQQAHAEGRLTLTEYDERAAMCWAARSQAELDVLTADLPPDTTTAARPAPVAPPRRSLSSRAGGVLGGAAALAVLGYSLFSIVGAADGAAVFGDRQATVTPGQQRVEIGMLFGDAEIVVPDGTRALTTGTVLFGRVDCAQACRPQAPGAPEVVLDASGAFGTVTVLTETEKRAQPVGTDRRDRDRDRDEDDDD